MRAFAHPGRHQVLAAAPSNGLPAYMSGSSVNVWGQIPNTVAPGPLKDYSGVGWRIETGIAEVLSALAGGHSGNYTNNEVRSLNLLADAPTWVLRRASSDGSTWDTTGASGAYFADGTPAPRHLYWDCIWVPERGRYVFGGVFWGSGAYSHNKTDGFDPVANAYDAAGTWANNPGGIHRGGRDPNTGIWYRTGYKWNPATDTWSSWSITGAAFNQGSLAWDSARGHFFHLSTGDNFSAGSSTIYAVKVTPAGVSTAITFNASAGYSDFVANASNFLTVANVYNPDLDCYYFYNGGAEGAQKVYKITPNAGTVWDMSLLPVSGVTPSVSLGTTTPGGVMNKFMYVSALKACVLVVPAVGVYFLRTS